VIDARSDAVERAAVALGDVVALTFDRLHVQQHRTGDLPRVRDHVDERVEIVTVDRPDVANPISSKITGAL